MYTKYLRLLLCATDKGRDDGQRMGGVVERQRAKKFGSLKNRFRVSFDKLFKAESGLYTRQPINPETFRADVESLLCQAAVRGEVEKDTIGPSVLGCSMRGVLRRSGEVLRRRWEVPRTEVSRTPPRALAFLVTQAAALWTWGMCCSR